MKRLVALILTMVMALCCTTSFAATDETLYSRILTLLEDGDETAYYDGLGLCITMDGADYPEGIVSAVLDADTGLIRIEYGEYYALWEHASISDVANTWVVLCGRWRRLTEGMTDSFQITLSATNGDVKDSITFTTAEEAAAFIQSIPTPQ